MLSLENLMRDGVLLAQVACLVIATLAIVAIIPLKSARLRSWCLHRFREWRGERFPYDPYDELDDLQHRVAQLESQVDQLLAEMHARGVADSPWGSLEISYEVTQSGRSAS